MCASNNNDDNDDVLLGSRDDSDSQFSTGFAFAFCVRNFSILCFAAARCWLFGGFTHIYIHNSLTLCGGRNRETERVDV